MRARPLALLVAITAVLPLLPAAADPAPVRPDSSVLVIAHRGASGLAPEHTLAAYDLAVAHGADYLEQDAQITADGVLVSVHDTTVNRTARGPEADCTGLVRDKTLAQLRRCDVGTWFNEARPAQAKPEYVGQRIPTMSEVFARFGKAQNYHVEIKDNNPETVRELLRLLDVHGLRASAKSDWQVLLQSFSPADLVVARGLDPAIPTVQLLASVPPAGPARDALLDRLRGVADGVGPSSGGVDKAFVDAAHARCLEVHPYTVDDPARLKALVAAGVDGVFTNRPDVLDEVLFPDRTAVRVSDAPLRNARTAATRNRACRG